MKNKEQEDLYDLARLFAVFIISDKIACSIPVNPRVEVKDAVKMAKTVTELLDKEFGR